MTVYCFDIDGTICTNTEGDYENAKPFPDAITLINSLHRQGNRIILQTARGFTTKIDWRAVTENQLKEWGLNYHELYFSKPTADVYIDDKAINAYKWHNCQLDPFTILESCK
jgi:hypothetical protein